MNMTEEQKLAILERLAASGANIGQINLGDGHQYFGCSFHQSVNHGKTTTQHIEDAEVVTEVSSSPLSWQQILTDYAVPDEKCKESYGSHNVRIAMYIKALEDVHLLNIAERQSDRALAFYQTLTDIFGYAIIQSSVEWQLNHFQENEKNKYTYETDILPLIKSLTKAA